MIEAVQDIPAMTPRSVHDYIRHVGCDWSGQGVAVECGCWLGATCAALAEGLVKAGYEEPVYCFDRWKANREEVEKAKRQGQEIHAGQNIQWQFAENVHSVVPDIRLDMTRTKLRKVRWHGGDIEIFLLDAAKSNPQFLHVMDEFGASFIPGVTIVGLLDFYFARKLGRELNQEQWIDQHSDEWTMLQTFDDASGAFFRYEGSGE